MNTLIQKVLSGQHLHRRDDLTSLLCMDLDTLCNYANEIRQTFCGNQAELCTILNARSGRCGEDCKFCAQSCHHKTAVEEYPFCSKEEILSHGAYNQNAGVQRFSLVTAGRGLHGEEFSMALDAYRQLQKNTSLSLCASHGFQSLEEFRALKACGVTRYHANLETSRRNFPNICTTHSYEDKLENIRRTKEAGLEICSGGILGMGETFEDRIDMAFDLAELGVVSIPLNLLNPIPGTPFAHLSPISNDDVLRTVAIFRIINPTAWIRMAAGRNRFSDGGAALFLSGANAAITGDMLTTTGTNIQQDKTMLTALGYQLPEKE